MRQQLSTVAPVMDEDPDFEQQMKKAAAELQRQAAAAGFAEECKKEEEEEEDSGPTAEEQEEETQQEERQPPSPGAPSPDRTADEGEPGTEGQGFGETAAPSSTFPTTASPAPASPAPAAPPTGHGGVAPGRAESKEPMSTTLWRLLLEVGNNIHPCIEKLEQSSKEGAEVAEHFRSLLLRVEHGELVAGSLAPAEPGSSSSSTASPPSRNLTVALCTQCMGREKSLMYAVPLNMLLLWLTWPAVVWYICFFGDDHQTADFCKRWRPAMDCGVLHVCSGGSSAVGMPWPPPEGTVIKGRKVMRWFHMSVAKNTAYVFAQQLEGRRRVLQGSGIVPPFSLVMCCLDADNIMGVNFLPAVFSQAAGAKYKGWVLHCCGSSAGATGRVCCWAEDWADLGGYDEEPGIVGSGAQDIDLRDRLRVHSGRKTYPVLRSLLDIGCAGLNNPDAWRPGACVH